MVPGIKALVFAAISMGLLTMGLQQLQEALGSAPSTFVLHLLHAALAAVSVLFALMISVAMHPEVVDGGDIELRNQWTAYLPVAMQKRIR